MARARLLSLLLLAAASCHALRDDKPMSPDEMCRYCCQQALDACKMDTDQFPMARCPPRYQECTGSCAKGDENEMCVVQTNRKLEAIAPKAKPLLPPVAAVKAPPPARRGACDQDGLWKLTIGEAHGAGLGCTGLKTIPAQVSFRVGRKQDEYVLRDLLPAPGWSDAFTIDSQPEQCVVTLHRDNQSQSERPRAVEVKLTEAKGDIHGSLRYTEAQPPATCDLEAPIVGKLMLIPSQALPSQAPPPPPPPTTAPSSPLRGRSR